MLKSLGNIDWFHVDVKRIVQWHIVQCLSKWNLSLIYFRSKVVCSCGEDIFQVALANEYYFCLVIQLIFIIFDLCAANACSMYSAQQICTMMESNKCASDTTSRAVVMQCMMCSELHGNIIENIDIVRSTVTTNCIYHLCVRNFFSLSFIFAVASSMPGALVCLLI